MYMCFFYVNTTQVNFKDIRKFYIRFEHENKWDTNFILTISPFKFTKNIQ